MKKLKENLRAQLSGLRERSTTPRSFTDKKADRAPWMGRLVSTAVDLGIYSMVFYSLTALLGLDNISQVSSVLIVTFPLYYLAVESMFGRSLGKIFMGYKMSIPESVSPKSFLIIRGLIRFVPVINFAMLLSWRRTTLLDLLSYTRIFATPASPSSRSSRSRKSRATRSSRSAESDPQGNPSKRSDSPPPKRGFDPRLLDR